MTRSILTSFIMIFAVGMSVKADTVYLIGNDASTAPSYTTAAKWDNGQPPSAGNDYVVDGYLLRTESQGTVGTFAGDSLTLANNGMLSLKGVNNLVFTINNLIGNGGIVVHAYGGRTYYLDGDVTIQSGGLSVNFTTSADDRRFVIDADITGTGDFNILGGAIGAAKELTLNGLASYTGSTAIEQYATLSVYGSMLIDVNDGSNSSISGLGNLVLDSALRLDVAGVTGDGSWNIIDVANLTESYGDSFGVTLAGGQGFTESQAGVWTLLDGKDRWEFTESTGVLTLTEVPEPATMALLAVGGLGVLLRKKHG